MKTRKIIVIVSIIVILSICVYAGSVYAINNKSIKSVDKYVKELNVNSNFVVKNQKNDKEIKINEKNIKVKYKCTNIDKDIYVAEDGTEYVLKENNLVGFIKKLNTEMNPKNILDLKAAEKIAKVYLKDNVKDFSKYENTYSNYKESYGEYNFLYSYKIDGYKTSDIIQISVDDTGEITAFAKPNEGIFEKYKNTKIDITKIEPIVLEEVKKEYNNLTEVNIKDITLGIVNEKLVMFIDVNMKFNNENNEEISMTDVFIYELD